MKLPVPVQADGTLYTDVKVQKASPLVIAATTDLAEEGDYYTAVLEWDAGVIAEIIGDGGSVTDAAEIRRLVRFMPFDSAYAVALHGMAATKRDDSIAGQYQCPKCKKVVKCEKGEKDGEEFDDTDHLFDLELPVLADPGAGLAIELSTPVELKKKDTGEIIETVTSLVLDWPTLGQCIKAHQRYPDRESMMQFALLADAIRTVNGKTRDGPWKMVLGSKLIEMMDSFDLAEIGDRMKRYSVNVEKERVCMKCHTRWMAPIDFNGFFGSGLRKQARR